MSNPIIKSDIPQIKVLLRSVFGTSEYSDISRLGGLTNHTYRIMLNNGAEYIVRLPGEGTEELINRNDERTNTMLACRLGIDAELLYFGNNGSKVSRYISGAVTMSAESLGSTHNLAKAAAVLRRLHDCGEDTGVAFDVFDMAASYERIILDNSIPLYDDYPEVKSKIMQIKQDIDSSGDVALVPCHNDPLCENWVLSSSGKMYLIDWEYGGMNDPMWDLADVSIEAAFSSEQDNAFLNAYFGKKPASREIARFQANKLYLDFLWALWGKARVPFDGEPMEQYALERYMRLKEHLSVYSLDIRKCLYLSNTREN